MTKERRIDQADVRRESSRCRAATPRRRAQERDMPPRALPRPPSHRRRCLTVIIAPHREAPFRRAQRTVFERMTASPRKEARPTPLPEMPAAQGQDRGSLATPRGDGEAAIVDEEREQLAQRCGKSTRAVYPRVGSGRARAVRTALTRATARKTAMRGEDRPSPPARRPPYPADPRTAPKAKSSSRRRNLGRYRAACGTDDGGQRPAGQTKQSAADRTGAGRHEQPPAARCR